MDARPSDRRGDRRGGRALRWLPWLAILAVAFVVRTRDIEAFYTGPDEGSYLHSAQIHEIGRGFHPITWVREDVAWARHLARHYADESVTYQHSYLHQLLARYLYRSGVGALASLRASSAILGAATALAAAWVCLVLAPRRRHVAWIAAALVAVWPLHAFYSRTGWGQIGCAGFYLVYVGLLARVLFDLPEGDRRGMRRAGWGMLLASTLAFGWQEGIAPYLVGSGFVVFAARLFAPGAGPRGALARLASRRVWTYAWSALPVGLATLALALWSPFARKYWFNTEGRVVARSWWEQKRLTSRDLLVDQRIDLQVGWIVLALALVGLLALARRDRARALYLLGSACAGGSILFVFFGDAWLLRAYMPSFAILIVFAAFGGAAVVEWLAARAGHLGAAACAGATLLILSWTTWTSLFGRVESPFFVQHFYARTAKGLVDHRHVDAPILARLAAERGPDERVAVFADKGAIFRLLDLGLVAREDYLEGPPETWPTWIVGVIARFEEAPRTVERGGAYRRVATDTISRWGLYKRAAP